MFQYSRIRVSIVGTVMMVLEGYHINSTFIGPEVRT